MSVSGWTEPTATPSQPVNKILFTSGSKVTINAPAEQVFDVITGFSRYGDWNTWTTAFEFSEPDAQIQSGSKGQLKTYMKEQHRHHDVPVVILELTRSTEKYRLAWQSQMAPLWLFTAERIHEVTPVEGSDGVCEVRQWESMSGPAAYVFKYAMGLPEQLNRANVNYLEELKAHAEKLSG